MNHANFLSPRLGSSSVLFVGALASVGGPAGTHLSSLINGAYSRLSCGRGGYISSPCRASANLHPLNERRMLGYPLRTARVHGRPPASRRPRSAFCRVLRCHRRRATPVTRPLLRLETVHPLAGSFLGSRADLLLASYKPIRGNARHPTRGGANGGAEERGRDGARSPGPGAGAMTGRRRRGRGRDAVFGDRTRAAHPPHPARSG